MVGPSSSHTAGACRLGLLARNLVGGTPERARIELHGSFARTGEGHGTDKAIAGGLMGFRPDDDRIREALDIADRDGLRYAFEKTTLGDDADVHPNTVRITVERGDRTHVMLGASLGAGRVLVSEIDGFPVEVHGNHHTIVLVAEDVKGSIARIAGLLADDGINIARKFVEDKDVLAVLGSWGSTVTLAVLMARNRTIALLAVPLTGLSRSSSSIARMPK